MQYNNIPIDILKIISNYYIQIYESQFTLPSKKFINSLHRYNLTLDKLRKDQYERINVFNLKKNIKNSNDLYICKNEYNKLKKFIHNYTNNNINVIYNFKLTDYKYKCICNTIIHNLHAIMNIKKDTILIIGSTCIKCFVPNYLYNTCDICNEKTYNRIKKGEIICKSCKTKIINQKNYEYERDLNLYKKEDELKKIIFHNKCIHCNKIINNKFKYCYKCYVYNNNMKKKCLNCNKKIKDSYDYCYKCYKIHF